MKLWFVEPRPCIFVSGIKDAVASKVVDYLLRFCPPESGLLIFQRERKAPGYRIYGMGLPHRKLVEISGLQLVWENDIKLENTA